MPVLETEAEVKEESVPVKAKPAKKKVAAKAKPAKKPAPKKAAKNDEEKERAGAVLQGEILSFMRKGKEYTSREVVEGLGRTPGNAEGQPVVNQLHKLVEDKKVKNVASEGRGFSWMKV